MAPLDFDIGFPREKRSNSQRIQFRCKTRVKIQTNSGNLSAAIHDILHVRCIFFTIECSIFFSSISNQAHVIICIGDAIIYLYLLQYYRYLCTSCTRVYNRIDAASLRRTSRTARYISIYIKIKYLRFFFSNYFVKYPKTNVGLVEIVHSSISMAYIF